MNIACDMTIIFQNQNGIYRDRVLGPSRYDRDKVAVNEGYQRRLHPYGCTLDGPLHYTYTQEHGLSI